MCDFKQLSRVAVANTLEAIERVVVEKLVAEGLVLVLYEVPL